VFEKLLSPATLVADWGPTMSFDLTSESYGELADKFAAVTHSLIAADSLQQSFSAIVALATTTIAGAEHAGITLLRRGEFATPAASDDFPRRVDQIQYSLRSGPCVNAILDNTTYRADDLSADERWPEFSARAVEETGVLSMMSMRLYFEDDTTPAGLNVYSTQRHAFDELAIPTGTLLATQAAIAMTAAARRERIAHLDQALVSSRDIGIGVGVLMARQLLTAEQAFDLLRVASQHSHRKVRDIAREVAETGTLNLPAG
jgi:hypothetical protein